MFIFFLCLFVLATSILCTALFYDYRTDVAYSKKELSQKLGEAESFENVVRENRSAVDTTYSKIVKFNPNVQALFLENDIKSSIAALKSVYERKSYDTRYKTFLQASTLYDKLFYDRRELRGNNTNIGRLNQLVEDCKLSTRQLQQTINSRAH